MREMAICITHMKELVAIATEAAQEGKSEAEVQTILDNAKEMFSVVCGDCNDDGIDMAEEVEFTDLTEIVKRRIVWDSVPCSQVAAMMPKLGVTPGSPDVEAKEHRDSHARLNRVAPIAPVLEATSALAGEVFARAILETRGIEPSDEDFEQYSTLLYSGSLAIIANLMELGLLHIGGFNSGILG